MNDRNERVPASRSWSVADRPVADTHLGVLNNSVVQQRHYIYCRVGYDFRQISLLKGGDISASDGAREEVDNRWHVVLRPVLPPS